MKKISFLMVTMLMACSMIMAQGPRGGEGRGERKEFDPKAHAERMTERMVKEYSLNDTQKQQLYELNLARVEKQKDRPAMRPNMRHDRRGPKAKPECVCNDSCKCCACCTKANAPKREEMKAEMEKMRAQMKEEREAYNTQLKTIMTSEQYAAYEKKQAERQEKAKQARDGRGEHRRGDRKAPVKE